MNDLRYELDELYFHVGHQEIASNVGEDVYRRSLDTIARNTGQEGLVQLIRRSVWDALDFTPEVQDST